MKKTNRYFKIILRYVIIFYTKFIYKLSYKAYNFRINERGVEIDKERDKNKKNRDNHENKSNSCYVYHGC